METFTHPISEALRATALALPETSEGTSCVNRAFKVRKKNFLFIGEKAEGVRVMLKLSGALPEAVALAAERSDVSVGKGGWVTLLFAPDEAPDRALLERWVGESFRLFAPKALLKQL